MKKVLCMAAATLLMASCSNNDENVPVVESEINATAIEITQNVKGVTTKAPITGGKPVTATVVMVDASGATADWSAFSPVTTNTVTGGNFADDTKRATVSSASFVAGTTTTVTLAPSLYYPASKHAHIAAVAPKGIISGQTVEIATHDGEQDVMYAASKDAGTSTAKIKLDLAFEHLTTQLNFKAKLVAAAADNAWGKKASVKSITIQAAQLPKAVGFADGSVTWTNAAELLVPNVNSVTFGTSTPSVVGNPVMMGASAELMVNVVITGGDGKDYDYNNVVIMKNVTDKLVTMTGKSHEIILTVQEPSTASGATEITTTATVKEWESGDAGSGELK